MDFICSTFYKNGGNRDEPENVTTSTMQISRMDKGWVRLPRSHELITLRDFSSKIYNKTMALPAMFIFSFD